MTLLWCLINSAGEKITNSVTEVWEGKGGIGMNGSVTGGRQITCYLDTANQRRSRPNDTQCFEYHSPEGVT